MWTSEPPNGYTLILRIGRQAPKATHAMARSLHEYLSSFDNQLMHAFYERFEQRWGKGTSPGNSPKEPSTEYRTWTGQKLPAMVRALIDNTRMRIQ